MFIARRLFGGSRVMPYDDLGVYPLLLRGGATARSCARFPIACSSRCAPTTKSIRPNWCARCGSSSTSAKRQDRRGRTLNVHRHTVFYRLRQIAEISGNDLDSAHDQLTLRTAMAIDALNSHER
jgi:hypothetical protein